MNPHLPLWIMLGVGFTIGLLCALPLSAAWVRAQRLRIEKESWRQAKWFYNQQRKNHHTP